MNDTKTIETELREALERCVQYLVFAYRDSLEKGHNDTARIAARDHEYVQDVLARAKGERSE